MSSVPMMSNGGPIDCLDWKRVQVALRNFEQKSDIHLSLLESHTDALLKLAQAKDANTGESNAKSVLAERSKAIRTVRQLVDDLKQIRELRSDLSPADWLRFDHNVQPLAVRIEKAVSDFQNASSRAIPMPGDPGIHRPSTNSSSSDACEAASSSRSLDPDYDAVLRNRLSSAGQAQHSTSLYYEPPDSAYIEADQALSTLEKDCLELNELAKDLACLVYSQHEMVDRIEGNVEHASDTLHHGAKDLAWASKLKVALFPVSGAAIGCVVGGPVGLVMGLKIGTVAAIGGGLLGGLSGHLIKKRMNQQTEEIELQIRPDHEDHEKSQ